MKVLFVSEASSLNTGYGIITRNLISNLIEEGVDVLELATHIQPDSDLVHKIKHPVILNDPPQNTVEYQQLQMHHMKDGAYAFDSVCLQYKPDVVVDIRDIYNYHWQRWSPARDFFNWVVCAPVDGIDQDFYWLDTLREADGVFTLSEWGKTTLEGENINVDGVLYTSTNHLYKAPSKEEKKIIKEWFPFDNDRFVFCTVMKNQPRKLFGPLFEGFRQYLDDNLSDDILYCHTNFSEGNWNIEQLLLRYNLFSNVVFTHYCTNCHLVKPVFYRDTCSYCPQCYNFTFRSSLCGDNIDDSVMHKIYGGSDAYIQLACREGLGMPQIEAHNCGLPIATANYAGMSDFVKSVGAVKIPHSLSITPSMNMFEAKFESQDISDALLLLKHKEYKSNDKFSNWKILQQSFIECVKSLGKPRKDWNTNKEIFSPLSSKYLLGLNLTNSEFVNFLIKSVLGRPQWCASYIAQKMITDLNRGYTHKGDYFYNQVFHDTKEIKDLDREALYNICFEYRHKLNEWERVR